MLARRPVIQAVVVKFIPTPGSYTEKNPTLFKPMLLPGFFQWIPCVQSRVIVSDRLMVIWDPYKMQAGKSAYPSEQHTGILWLGILDLNSENYGIPTPTLKRVSNKAAIIQTSVLSAAIRSTTSSLIFCMLILKYTTSPEVKKRN